MSSLCVQVVIDMCGSSKNIISTRKRIMALDPAKKKEVVKVLTDIWHAQGGVKVHEPQHHPAPPHTAAALGLSHLFCPCSET